MQNRFKLMVALMLLFTSAIAQKEITLETVSAFDPIIVHKPVLLDSVNLKNTKYSDNILLSSSVSIPVHERFINKLDADTAGFFHIAKTENEYAFHLLSFYLEGDSYGKAKLKVTSPNAFEVFIDGEKKASKTNANDSISKAGSTDATLSGLLNNSRVVVKLLSSNKNAFNSTAVKIEVSPNDEDSLLNLSFSNNPSRRITIKDILEGKRVTSSRISPSGRFVLLNLSETMPGGTTKGYVEVYDTKQNRTILFESLNRAQFKWMPKSDLLSYVTDTEAGRTMFTLDPLSMAINTIAEGLPSANFTIAPDEKSVFYSDKETLSVKSPAGLKRLIAPDDRQPGYRDRYFLFQYFFDSGLSQQITFGKRSASLVDISNDAKFLLFSTSEEDLLERPFRKTSMYNLNLETMNVDTLWEGKTFISSAAFSPDNQNVLVTGGPEAFEGIGLNIKEGQIANSYDTQAFIVNLKTKQVDPITKNFNPSISSQLWNSFDNLIYFKVQDGDRENVYSYNSNSRKYTKLNLEEDVVKNFNIANGAAKGSYVGVSSSNSNRAYVINLKSGKSELVSDPYKERLANIDLGDVLDWNFTSSFGDEIEGRYYLPPNFDPNKKYPLIVYYYAGTSPTQRVFETTYPWHVYAAQDYIVYTLQPSGTTGFGQEFSARHVNAWGKQTADEIIEGTKAFVSQHPFVDEKHIGCIGASYGGFMTQYLQTQTDLFAAAVSHAGISNIASYWGGGYWGYTYSSGASAGSYPWNNPGLYTNQSPLFHADKIKTPLLLLHGSVDTNVPLEESIQMYTALKLLGKEVEFIQVEGENHAIYNYNKRIEWNNAIYAWFAKWLKNDKRWWESMYPTKD